MEQKFNFEKYKDGLLKLTKLKDTRFSGNHPNEIYEGTIRTGVLHLENSQQYQCIFLLTSATRYFHTSQVVEIEEHEGYDLIKTLNSVYKIELHMDAVPGVQEKHSIKLLDSE